MCAMSDEKQFLERPLFLKVDKMKVFYINLDHRTDRNKNFLGNNNGICDFERVSGIVIDDIKKISYDLIKERILDYPLPFITRGALGCFLTHKKIWELALERKEYITIAEDDAILNVNFANKAEEIIDNLPPYWEIILWGWNFNRNITVELFTGVKSTMAFDHDALIKNVAHFRSANYESSHLKLLEAFGTLCYSISPRGVAAIKNFLFPIKQEENMTNEGLDVMLNKNYPSLQAYAAFPPLACSPNIDSDIQGEAIGEILVVGDETKKAIADLGSLHWAMCKVP